MLQRITVYQIEAHLKLIDGSITRFPFQISARSYGSAETQLEEYLTKNKKDTGLIYESVVGMSLIATKSLIVDLLDDNHVIIDASQLVNEKQVTTDPQVLMLVNLLKDVIGDGAFFGYKYPSGIKALKDFLNKASLRTSITLRDSDFSRINEMTGVDEDGYPWIRETIQVLPYGIFVNLLICHHAKWDFYIEKVQF